MPSYFRMRRLLSLPIAAAPLPEGIVLTPLTRDGAIAGRELMKRVYPQGLNDGGITAEGWWAWLTADAEYDPALIYIAMQGGSVVGFCHCWSVPFVKDLVVDADYRQRGLGAALLTLALQEFRGRGARYVDLKTDTDNFKAQSLYRRLGFEIVERVED